MDVKWPDVLQQSKEVDQKQINAPGDMSLLRPTVRLCRLWESNMWLE